MLREVYPIIPLTIATLAAVVQLLVNAEVAQQQQQQQPHQQQQKQQHQQEEQQHHEQQLHPSLFVDTKYWTRNTEFGERDNWHDSMKPCTLLERIKLNEQAVVSMGDSLDSLGGALESTIKELVLATNGVLLLEEDTLSDQADSVFIQYLNESGDCFDSSSTDSGIGVAGAAGGGGRDDDEEDGSSGSSSSDHSDQAAAAINHHRHSSGRLFEFQPDSDQMSWFNPDNWQSTLNFDEIVDWVPESHRIPCTEDVVVFGDRLSNYGSTLFNANERAKVLSFKVNFRASQWSRQAQQQQQQSNSAPINNVRVAKLKIGDQQYNQYEFNRLISSEPYENILFQFNDSLGLLKAEEGFENPVHTLLTIDESSIQLDSEYDLCLEETGCMCGNENANVMKAICSFSDPIDMAEQPCYDPIASTGYCNKVCATVLTISMDPTRFSERFVANTVSKMMKDDEDGSNYFSRSVFLAGRRTHDTRYEITFRLTPKDDDASDYEASVGREREFAELVFQALNRGKWRTANSFDHPTLKLFQQMTPTNCAKFPLLCPRKSHLSISGATKSFYGIKSISVKSSLNWRTNNRSFIFWTSFIVFSLATALIVAYQEGYSDGSNRSDIVSGRLLQIYSRLINSIGRVPTTEQDTSQDETETFVRFAEPNVMKMGSSQIYGSISEIPLIEMDSEDVLSHATNAGGIIP